jgi:hypothetical protein
VKEKEVVVDGLKCETLAIESREHSSVIGILCAKSPLREGRFLESGETSPRSDELFNGLSDRSRWQRPGYGKFLYCRYHVCHSFLNNLFQHKRDRWHNVHRPQ